MKYTGQWRLCWLLPPQGNKKGVPQGTPFCLHLFRSGEAQDVDAGFQHLLGKADQADIASLQVLILLGHLNYLLYTYP